MAKHNINNNLSTKSTIIDMIRLLEDNNSSKSNFTLSLYSPGIGSGPTTNSPSNLLELTNALELVSKVYNEDGSLNEQSSVAETYAISLAFANKYAAAYDLFSRIIIPGISKLSEGLISESKNNILEPVINKYGKLGFEGIYQYARIADTLDRGYLSRKLLTVLAEIPETYFGSVRFGDIRVTSLDKLVNEFNEPKYQSKLNWAKSNQF